MYQLDITREISKSFFDGAILKGDLLQLLFGRLKEADSQQDKDALVEFIQSVSRMISEDCGVYLRHSK